jgi:hypothetical protein
MPKSWAMNMNNQLLHSIVSLYPPQNQRVPKTRELNSQSSRRPRIARATRLQHPHGVHGPQVHKEGEHLPPRYWVISESRRRERRCDASTYLIQELDVENVPEHGNLASGPRELARSDEGLVICGQ